MEVINVYVADFIFFIAVHKNCIVISCAGAYITYMKIFIKCLMISTTEAEIICFET